MNWTIGSSKSIVILCSKWSGWFPWVAYSGGWGAQGASNIIIVLHHFFYNKMYLEMSSAKCWPFYLSPSMFLYMFWFCVSPLSFSSFIMAAQGGSSLKRIMNSMSFNNHSERPTVIHKRSHMTGWLRKQGGVVKSWHRRWFVLHGDMLTYYNNPSDYKKLGEFLLPGNIITEHPHNPQEPDKFLFEIKPGMPQDLTDD